MVRRTREWLSAVLMAAALASCGGSKNAKRATVEVRPTLATVEEQCDLTPYQTVKVNKGYRLEARHCDGQDAFTLVATDPANYVGSNSDLSTGYLPRGANCFGFGGAFKDRNKRVVHDIQNGRITNVREEDNISSIFDPAWRPAWCDSDEPHNRDR